MPKAVKKWRRPAHIERARQEMIEAKGSGMKESTKNEARTMLEVTKEHYDIIDSALDAYISNLSRMKEEKQIEARRYGEGGELSGKRDAAFKAGMAADLIPALDAKIIKVQQTLSTIRERKKVVRL